MAMEKDPELFGEKKNNDNEESASSYGAMGSEKKKRPLTNEEKEELKAQGAGFSALWIISPLLMV
eukprot:14341499-Ditylum_brightwellii.AAC.1